MLKIFQLWDFHMHLEIFIISPDERVVACYFFPNTWLCIKSVRDHRLLEKIPYKVWMYIWCIIPVSYRIEVRCFLQVSVPVLQYSIMHRVEKITHGLLQSFTCNTKNKTLAKNMTIYFYVKFIRCATWWHCRWWIFGGLFFFYLGSLSGYPVIVPVMSYISLKW